MNSIYAIITPNIGSVKRLKVSNFDEIVALVEQLRNDHATYVAETSHHWREDLDSVVDVGFSFSVEREDGAHVVVGVCQRGWALHRIEPKPIRFVPGTQAGDDIVAILNPEWTEYRERELLSPEAALTVLHRWLEADEGPLAD